MSQWRTPSRYPELLAPITPDELRKRYKRAFLFALGLPGKETPERVPSAGQRGGYASKAGALAYLCLFITVITIDSGLMYQAQGPAFSHLEWLTSWYWAVPYIAAVLIMRNLPRKTNRVYILYVAVATT